jgi:hypothetical protein
MSSSLVMQVHSLDERRQNAGTITTGPIQQPFSKAIQSGIGFRPGPRQWDQKAARHRRMNLSERLPVEKWEIAPETLQNSSERPWR